MDRMRFQRDLIRWARRKTSTAVAPYVIAKVLPEDVDANIENPAALRGSASHANRDFTRHPACANAYGHRGIGESWACVGTPHEIAIQVCLRRSDRLHGVAVWSHGRVVVPAFQPTMPKEVRVC